MEKIKTQRFVCLLLIVVFAIAVQPCLYGQNYLSKEKENEIKISGNYYWGESSDFDEEIAKMNASVELSNHIIKDAVGQSNQLDEILKTIDTGAHLDRLPQQGKIKILAWIPKDSVLLTVAVQRQTTQQTSDPQTTISIPIKERYVPEPKKEIVDKVEPVFQPETIAVATDNPVLQQLAACKTYADVRRVATMNGLVRGKIGSGSEGFSNPENCIIAVFTADGMLSALLDAGGNSRTDLLSGKVVQNPEQFYSQNEYFLWYMQQKN